MGTSGELARRGQEMQGDLEFRVLGPIELWSGGQQYDLGAARTRCVLAILLLTLGTVVPTEVLIDRLWESRPPPKARESLSAYIARLRGSLRQALGDSVRLDGRLGGYVLDVDPETVDVHRFRRLRRQADALTASGDYDHAGLLLREADGLWRGQALAGVGGDWVARMRDSLEEERRAAIVKRVECDLELGRHADLVGELSRLLAAYPLDEMFIAHQMTALCRSGRPGDALSLYRETRSRLARELGTEPGPMLSELHQRILRGDPQLAVGPAGQGPGRVPGPDTLPPQAVEFVGRREELGLLTRESGDSPLVRVIEGMPGVGKTALAAQAARITSGQYPDGVFYLNFHAHDPGHPSLDAPEALHRLLQMLGMPSAQIPDAIGDRNALWRAQLNRRRAVVILDDVARPDQIRPLLPRSGQSLILITSRHRLPGLEGARALTLDVLSIDDAITLFRRVAGHGSAHEEDEVAAAVQLCGRLPLAIQLTASRLVRDYPPTLGALVEELSHSPVLAGGADAASPGWFSAFDLSYRALEPGHQRFFRRLGMSPCARISLHAAAALGGGSLAETEKALAALLDHHLLAPAPADQFRFHDLIRGYAAMRARADDPRPEQRQAVGRLVDYYLHTTDKADRVLRPFGRRMPVAVTRPPAATPALDTHEEAAEWLDSEWRNILQAAQHAGRHEWKAKCADLVRTLAGFMEINAYWDEAIPAHTLALQACRDLADPLRIAQASLALSEVSHQTGRHEAALPLAEDAMAIYRSLADQRGEAEALDQIGTAHSRAGRSREALAYFREAEIAYRGTTDRHGVANTLSHSSLAYWHLGRYPEAMGHLREALSLYRDAGDRRGEAKTLNNLGRMQLNLGYHRDALDNYQKSLKIFREIGGPQNEAILYHNIGSVYSYKESYEEGLAAYRRALSVYRSIGDIPNEAEVLNDIGTIYRKSESYDEALIYHQKARLIAEEIGNLPQKVIALRGEADVGRGSSRYRDAMDHYHAALGLARQIGDLYEEAKVLQGIAETTLSVQRPDKARIVFRQALDIFERLGVPEAESVRIRIEAMTPSRDRQQQYSDAAASPVLPPESGPTS
jgi:DNA-binding SARP family transcriptional activator/tetratricopeptide (TPR) repeat protein